MFTNNSQTICFLLVCGKRPRFLFQRFLKRRFIVQISIQQNNSKMSVKIEISIRQRQIQKELIEDVIWKLVEQKKFQKNSMIHIPSIKFPEFNEFEDQLHCVSFNNLPENIDKANLSYIYYEFSDQGPETEAIESHDEHVAASTHWILPNKDDGFLGLWESLVYDDNIKENLLDFAETMLHFSKKNVDQNIISCNRLILLHGLPGTGKKHCLHFTNT